MQELALLLGIVTAEWLVIYPRMANSSGYLWLALKRTSVFLMLAIAARWVTAWVLLQLSLLSNSTVSRSLAWAALVGLVTVLFPSILERFLDHRATARFVSSSLIQLLLRYNLLIGQSIKQAVQKLKEQDNFDCQNSKGWWDSGLPREQINRRLRILYESLKLDIACRYREPELLRHDINISPGQKFYLVVSQLGRRRLKDALKESPCSPPPGLDWDGRERRRERGSKSDRRSPDPNARYSRVYDEEDLRERITRGIAFDSSIGQSNGAER